MTPRKILIGLILFLFTVAILCSCSTVHKTKTVEKLTVDSSRVSETSNNSLKKNDITAVTKTVDTTLKTEEATFVTETEKSFDLVEVDPNSKDPVILANDLAGPQTSEDNKSGIKIIKTSDGRKFIALPREKKKETGQIKKQENKGVSTEQNIHVAGSDSSANKVKEETKSHIQDDKKIKNTDRTSYTGWIIFGVISLLFLILLIICWIYWKQIKKYFNLFPDHLK